MNNKDNNALFCLIFHTCYDKLHRYAYTLLKNNEEANDVVQSVFARLWEKQHDVIFEEGINAYLYKSVYNLCLNHMRKTRTTKDYMLHAVKDPAYTIQSSPENQALAAELSGRITAAINGLPTQCRLIFLMSREKEKKYTEIAQELDISVKTVEAQMSKALRLLRERLADCLVLFPLLLYIHYTI